MNRIKYILFLIVIITIGCGNNVKVSKEDIKFERIKAERTKRLTNSKWLIFNIKNKRLDTDLTLNKNLQDSVIVEFNSTGELLLNEIFRGSWKSSYFIHDDKKHITSHLKIILKDTTHVINIPNAIYRFEFYGSKKEILRLVMDNNEEGIYYMCTVTLYSLNLKE